jgi:translation initiation factor IF-2
MRVHELAKELGMGSKELVDKLKAMNVPIKGHMSGLDDDTVELIRQEFATEKEKAIEENILEVDFPVTVKDFAVKIGKKPSELIQMLMSRRKMLNLNQSIDMDTAADIARELGINLQEKKKLEEVLETVDIGEQKPAHKRPPIVTIMGHIDHGKTTLLDYIRKSRVAAKESGGITQHISVYTVDTSYGQITFVDTPGHETFTAMRARGANVTDIVILVVAADDGIMPQTQEAISHARAAGVPIIVAINKIDKPNVNIDMVKQQLAKNDLAPEDWGGKTITVPLSAVTGKGVDQLLEMISLQAEIMELKADYERPAVGVVVEASLSKNLGPVATVIVQQGIVHIGDTIVCGTHSGRVRILRDDFGRQVNERRPSQAVEIIGLTGVPLSGDKFFVVPSEKEAHSIIARRLEEEKARTTQSDKRHVRLEDLYDQMQQGEVKTLNLIIKADTYGTLEAIEGMLLKVDLQEISLNILHKGVGVINMSDVILADASSALIFGFKVDVEGQASKKAQEKGIEIKTYQIIYELTLDLKAAIEGMLKPDVERVFAGRARVKQVFNLTKSGIIAGSLVEKGQINRNQHCTVTRDGQIIHEGKVQTLKRFKDDVREVKEGLECGIGVGYRELQEGDIIETFEEKVTTKRIKI